MDKMALFKKRLFTDVFIRDKIARNALLWQLCAAIIMIITIFIADTITDLEIAAAVFYVAVILLCVRFMQTRGVIFVAVICVLLTIISYFMTRSGSAEAGIINGFISSAAIVVSTVLALQTRNAQRAVQEAREQVVHMARVMTLGELTASIAHEVNQPLAALTTNGHACQRWLASTQPNLEKAQSAVARMIDDASRASEIIGRVRNLVRRKPTAQQWVSLNELVHDIIMLIRPDIERDQIILRLKLSVNLSQIFADPVEIEQVLMNLIGNAIESLRAQPESNRLLNITTVSGENGTVCLMVTDSGAGVKPEQLRQIFEAFYTTKAGGMGIGLAISKTIIEAHGGHISARHHKPQGLTVEFTLECRAPSWAHKDGANTLK